MLVNHKEIANAEKLEKWRGLQCLGLISEDDQAIQLDSLQPICEGLVENLWMIRQQVDFSFFCFLLFSSSNLNFSLHHSFVN